MFFEWINDPAAWVGLATLILLEIVLGIDNLVFIAILADKLPESQRNKARLMGLGLALMMRMLLLSTISWIVTLTQPLFTIGIWVFSGRDLIMIGGGLFLLAKGTMELHERLEGHNAHGKGGGANAVLWQVLIQIVALDAIFSLDSVITAVGMVHHLSIMISAVIVSMAIMMALSKPLMMFVSRHPTVVVLCLGFLMMIGMSLLAEGFGFHVEKNYMYAAIAFAVLIESFNLLARRNVVRMVTTSDLRDKTASAILSMLGARTAEVSLGETAERIVEQVEAQEVFSSEERDMVRGVLSLGDRTVNAIMTPRNEVDWIDINDTFDAIRKTALETVHSRLIIADGDLENIVGMVTTKEILVMAQDAAELSAIAKTRKPLMVPETSNVMQFIDRLRVAPLQIAIVFNEHGSISGVVTPNDIFEVIAGEFPDQDEKINNIENPDENSWEINGWTDIEVASSAVNADLGGSEDGYQTLGGFVLYKMGTLPTAGQSFEIEEGLKFEIIEMDGLQVGKVRITRI